MNSNVGIPSVLVRIALGIPYLWFGSDRLGLLGPPGGPRVSWGDWDHFMTYARTVMSFVPDVLVEPLAMLATVGELGLGLLLIAGLTTRLAAAGSAMLSLLFAVSMAISFGIESPLAYSVFTVSAASLLLAAVPGYPFSVDSLRQRSHAGR